MKQLYFFAAAVLFGTVASAQAILPAKAEKDSKTSHVKGLPTEAVMRDAIWSHDCNIANCSDWVFGNGADQAGTDWFEIDINFECTTEGPSGPYNQWAGGAGDGTAATPINSTTSDNGFIMVDSDLFGDDANYDAAWVENCWFQTAMPIDCSAEEFVTISLETRYRYWDVLSSDAQCFIEISRDGVNWPSIETRDEESGYVVYGTDTVPSRKVLFPGYGNTDTSEDPAILEFDISEAAGNESTVYVRFRWMGTWGYSWEIDDIQIYPTPANDTRIDNYYSYTDYERTGVYEYGAWEETQIPADLQAGAKVYNVGFQDQTGVGLELDVNGTQYNSDMITLAYTESDTLGVPYFVSGLGAQALNMELISDSVDENPANNMVDFDFTVTQDTWGRDNGISYGSFMSDGSVDYVAMSLYDIVEDVTVYSIDVALLDGTEAGTSVIAHLYDGSDADFLTDAGSGIIASSEEYDIIEGNTNPETGEVTTWYHFLLDGGYELSAGDWVGVGFEHYGGSVVNLGESKYTQDQTAFVFFEGGSGYAWYYSNNVPMIRLNLDPNVVENVNEAVAGTGFELFNSFPNPANESTRINYNLNNPSEVALEVCDLAGKVVYNQDFGTQGAGMNNITLDVSAFAPGAYTYTLTVNGERASNRLMVK